MPIDARRLRKFIRADDVARRHLADHADLIEQAVVDDGKRAMLSIPVDGDELNILYRETAANLLAREYPVNNRTPFAVYAALLAEVVESWDLLDDQGESWPLDRYRLEDLGKPVLTHLWNVLREVELTPA